MQYSERYSFYEAFWNLADLSAFLQKWWREELRATTYCSDAFEAIRVENMPVYLQNKMTKRP